MNDRFAAQLRQHLLETADVRPADGQLGRVLAGVAATAQRHPAAARLTWIPGRIGPIPSTSIRYGLIAAALALAAMSGAGLAGGIARLSSVFEGTWTTIDRVDGSGMTLVVGAGRTPAVYFEDGYASGPSCVNDRVKRFTARGSGEISDNRLVATFPDGGGCGFGAVAVPGSYVHDQGEDTLTDQGGGVWIRALSEQPETEAPETQAPASPSVTPDESIAIATPGPDRCIQFDRPGTYTAPAGSLSLTVAMPGTVAEPWNGDVQRFGVMRAACADSQGSGWIGAGGVTAVDTSACDGPGSAVHTTTEAVEAVSGAEGIDVVEQTDVTVDGHVGTRFDITVKDVPNACPDQQIPLVDGLSPLDLAMHFRLYLIDVDGTTLALGLYGYADWDSAVRQDADRIIASMQINP